MLLHIPRFFKQDMINLQEHTAPIRDLLHKHSVAAAVCVKTPDYFPRRNLSLSTRLAVTLPGLATKPPRHPCCSWPPAVPCAPTCWERHCLLHAQGRPLLASVGLGLLRDRQRCRACPVPLVLQGTAGTCQPAVLSSLPACHTAPVQRGLEI